MEHFLHVFSHYLNEIVPALAIGFFISGLVHEMVPEDIVLRYLGNKGIKAILLSALIGTLLPICCWGSLPIAISFQKKGAKLGPILAFLVATPATSISALFVAYSVLGVGFTVYIFFAVIIMGLIIGLIGNSINVPAKHIVNEESCPHCKLDNNHIHTHKKRTLWDRAMAILKYAYVTLPREIGIELFVGLVLAAIVATFVPIGNLIRIYLSGWFGYVFSVIFGILMYICSTASIPLVDSLINQGMSIGAGMTLLLIGPVTSYGTMLVMRKEYGIKVLSIFLTALIILSLALGVGFELLPK